MPAPPSRIQLLREAGLRERIRRHLQEISGAQTVDALCLFADKLTCVINDIDLFYTIATTKGRDVVIYPEIIEALLDVPAQKGITPWKLILHHDYHSEFERRYGTQVRHANTFHHFYTGRRRTKQVFAEKESP